MRGTMPPGHALVALASGLVSDGPVRALGAIDAADFAVPILRAYLTNMRGHFFKHPGDAHLAFASSVIGDGPV